MAYAWRMHEKLFLLNRSNLQFASDEGGVVLLSANLAAATLIVLIPSL